MPNAAQLDYKDGNRCRLGRVSLWISATEVAVFVASIAFVHGYDINRPSHAARVVLRLAASAWIFGGMTSMIVALVDLALDARKKIAMAAAFTSLAVFLLCGTQMLV